MVPGGETTFKGVDQLSLRSSFFTKARSSAISFRIICSMAASRPGFEEAVAFLPLAFFFVGVMREH
ncbi:hypothetical protein IVB56_24845 [Bradyrhizobium sp. CW7]|nr:hypothetical protein [Bradyrhizobium sp. CW7]